MNKTVLSRKRGWIGSNKDMLLLFLLVILTASQISVYIPFYSQSVVLLFTTVYVYSIDSRYFQLTHFGVILLYFVIVFLNFMSGDKYFANVVHVFEEIGNLLLPSAVLYYVLLTNNIKLMRALVVSFLLYVVVITISSAIIETAMPGAMRLTVVYANTGQFDEINAFLRKGLSSYMFPHALPIVIPPLIMGINNRLYSLNRRILLSVILGFVLYLIYLSSVATALLLAIFIFFASIFVRDLTDKNRLVPLLVGGIILFFVISYWLENGLLHDLASIFDDTAFGSKFDDMERSYHSGVASGDIESRASKYRITTEAMSGNILIGSNAPMGGHSAFYDRLGCLGLIGFIPYAIFIYLQIKLTKRFISEKFKGYYWLGMVAAFAMLLSKNTSNWHLWSVFLLYMPLMIIYFSNKSQIVIKYEEQKR